MEKHNLDLFFEKQEQNTYLVYNLKENDILDETSLGMLKNNKIEGLLSVYFTQINGNSFLRYNISDYTTVKNVIKDNYVNKNQCISIIKGILNAFISIGDYMIEENMLLLDLDYIFVNMVSYETNLICLPIENRFSEKINLSELIKNIVFNLKREQNDDSTYIAEILNYLNSNNTFSLFEFVNILNSIDIPKPLVNKKYDKGNIETFYMDNNVTLKNDKEIKNITRNSTDNYAVEKSPIKDNNIAPNKTKKQENIIIPNLSKSKINEDNETEVDSKKMSLFYLLQHYNKENANIYKSQRKNINETQKISKLNKPKEIDIPSSVIINDEQTTKNEFNIPQTTVLSNDMNFGATTILTNTFQCKPYIIRLKNNSTLCIDKPVFRIGKEERYVDYFINDNSAISRSHADIITNNGRYFIKDRNSTNHTFIDGNLIQSEIEYEIFSGNKIRLADEDFEFKVY